MSNPNNLSTLSLRISILMQRIQENVDEISVLINRIKDQQLFHPHYESFDDYCNTVNINNDLLSKMRSGKNDARTRRVIWFDDNFFELLLKFNIEMNSN